MKIQLLSFVVLLTITQSLIGQTKKQQKEAETYYKNEQLVNKFTNSWYWLFGPSNSQENNKDYSNLKQQICNS